MNKNVYLKLIENLSFQDILSIIEPINDVSNLDLNFLISDICTIENTTQDSITFFKINELFGSKNIKYLSSAKAKFCIVSEKDSKEVITLSKMIPLIVKNDAFVDFLKICEKFLILRENKLDISSTAKIMNNVFIGDNVTIEENVTIFPNVYLENVYIKKNTIIYANSTIQKSIIGENCIIHPGVKIGQDGFGFINVNNKIIKINHYGSVIIEDNVEIGANTAIDRGTLDDTIIGHYTKIDNLVQIAHNVKIGNGTFIAGQTGIAGSTIIGNQCMIGGQVAIVGHIEIGNQSIIYGRSAVSKSFPDKSKIFSGWVAEDYNKWVGKVIFFNLLYSKINTFKSIFRFFNKIKRIKIKFLTFFK